MDKEFVSIGTKGKDFHELQDLVLHYKALQQRRYNRADYLYDLVKAKIIKKPQGLFVSKCPLCKTKLLPSIKVQNDSTLFFYYKECPSCDYEYVSR